MDDRRILLHSALPILSSAISCALLALEFAFNWGGDSTVRTVDALVFAAFGLYAAGCTTLAARAAQGRNRTAWTIMAIGLYVWAAGELTRALFTLVFKPVFPSPAEFLYLVFVVLVCVAFVLFPAEPNQGSRMRVLFDALIVAM